MSDSTQLKSPATIQQAADRLDALRQADPLELAQVLAEKLAIQPNDWHRLSRDRKVRAQEQAAAALVYLLNNQPEEAQVRLQQAVGWLDRSITAPPCPTHGERRQKQSNPIEPR